ncbi:MAG: hypothetical protein A4E29_00091 [Methanomassiliicoccales archaeon PtaB.Bin134]|nr:MAG: hypothetical protein A4E29_00091 [Methanomassiliicoccales archaeon PtaB.Bin134]
MTDLAELLPQLGVHVGLAGGIAEALLVDRQAALAGDHQEVLAAEGRALVELDPHEGLDDHPLLQGLVQVRGGEGVLGGHAQHHRFDVLDDIPLLQQVQYVPAPGHPSEDGVLQPQVVAEVGAGDHEVGGVDVVAAQSEEAVVALVMAGPPGLVELGGEGPEGVQAAGLPAEVPAHHVVVQPLPPLRVLAPVELDDEAAPGRLDHVLVGQLALGVHRADQCHGAARNVWLALDGLCQGGPIRQFLFLAVDNCSHHVPHMDVVYDR